jgi:hypothetical protein
MTTIPQDARGTLAPVPPSPRADPAARIRRPIRARLTRLAYPLLELCAAFVFFWAVAHHVATFDLKPLAAFCVPFLIVFYGLAALLFNRGKSLAKGRAQARSLYAAERATQATVLYLLGILLGTTLYGILVYLGLSFDPHRPGPAGLWLLLFVAPYALMQAGFVYLMRALRLVAPQLLPGASAFELRRRVQP